MVVCVIVRVIVIVAVEVGELVNVGFFVAVSVRVGVFVEVEDGNFVGVGTRITLISCGVQEKQKKIRKTNSTIFSLFHCKGLTAVKVVNFNLVKKKILEC